MTTRSFHNSARVAASAIMLTVTFNHVAVAQDAKTHLTYEQQIRPIFRAHCFDCHGATEKVEGKLDLRLVRFLKSGGESGPAIVPGKPDKSYLLDRVKSGEMPPGENRLSAAEINTLEKWIAAGAKTARPEPESIGPGLGITPEERSFWSYQPIKRPSVPDMSGDSRIRTPIDALLKQAMPNGLSFSQDADRPTLIKRLFLDVIGLPPTPTEMQKWTTEPSENWYEQLVDHLLDSEHYGERWGRHWLDIAGYADSEGYNEKDTPREWAWKYRDYVIRSLNADKPFDRFLTEQLAGDEIMPSRSGDLTAEQIELLTATGFLRMAADGTGSGSNNADGRNQVMADTIRIVSTSLLGLSVGCAQCHDHRYDPIPQSDYYSLRAIFEPALDWQKWQVPSQRRVSLYTAADRKQAADLEAQAKKLSDEKAVKQKTYMAEALEKELQKYKEPLRAQLRDAYNTPGNKRSAEQKALLKTNPSVNISPGVLYQYLPKRADELKKIDAQIKEVRAKKPTEEFLRVLLEPAGHSPVTKLFHRGDHQQPKQAVPPAGLSVLGADGRAEPFVANDESRPTTGRRLAFAKWLTNGKNALLPRVIVNRIWMHHFGRGIVSTPADFGVLGVRPTHPELLDWLADEFMRQGWSMKKLHRLILTSTAWRQSSVPSPAMTKIDPENNFYWRKPIVRLEAETLRDRMLVVAGVLDRKLFGRPVGVKEDDTGQVIVDGGQKRRSLYVTARRSQPVAMMQTFDAPVMETNCECRTNSTVATQSLMLINGSFTLDAARAMAIRCEKEATTTDASAYQELLSAFSRISDPWQFGYGFFDKDAGKTQFTKLSHWTGSQWQAGPALPDPKLGWVLLNANGGHPDVSGKAAIRRWVASAAGVVKIEGTLSHPNENGDGVQGTIVSSRAGVLGTWTAAKSNAQTNVGEVKVQVGDAIDFITGCRTNHTSDSFSWPVKLTLTSEGMTPTVIDSTKGFAGPKSSPQKLLGQVIRAFELALCRRPTDDEIKLTLPFIAEQLAYIHVHPASRAKDTTASQQAITNLCQALLSSNEFLYVE